MKRLLITTFLIGLLHSMAIGQIVDREFSSATGKVKLLGKSSYKRLTKAPFKSWFVKNEKSYAPESSTVVALQKELSIVDSITVFMGTWCGDSKREVPRLMKTLKHSGYDLKKVNIICLDNQFNNYKQSPENEQFGLNIRRVPTVLLHQDKKELGRIVERPVETIEKDLLSIDNQTYTPNYDAVARLDKYLADHDAEWINSNQEKLVEIGRAHV